MNLLGDSQSPLPDPCFMYCSSVYILRRKDFMAKKCESHHTDLPALKIEDLDHL